MHKKIYCTAAAALLSPHFLSVPHAPSRHDSRSFFSRPFRNGFAKHPTSSFHAPPLCPRPTSATDSRSRAVVQRICAGQHAVSREIIGTGCMGGRSLQKKRLLRFADGTRRLPLLLQRCCCDHTQNNARTSARLRCFASTTTVDLHVILG